MTRTRAGRLRMLAQLAALAENDARLRLGRANAELHRREAQQLQLADYAREYAERWVQAGRQGIDGHTLGRLAAFRASLDATLEVQHEAVTQARAGSVQAVERWRAARNRQRAFDELTARAQRGEESVAQRREQQRIDDIGAAGPRNGSPEQA